MKKQWSLLVICKILNVPNLRSCQRKTERKTFSNLTTAENYENNNNNKIERCLDG